MSQSRITRKHHAQGFTLVELIIVMIILGILAATAAPKFMDFGSDARRSALEGLAGALRSAVEMSHYKAALQGVEDLARSDVDVDGDIVEMKYGYPEAYAEHGNQDILDMLEIVADTSSGKEATDTSGDWKICYGSGKTGGSTGSCDSSNSSHVRIGFDTHKSDGCYIRYIEATGTPTEKDGVEINDYQLIIYDAGC